MPYDPRQMQQLTRMGIGMMGQQPGPYDKPANVPAQFRPKQWWEGLPSMPAQSGGIGGAQSPQPAGNAPPSLLDMLMQYGGGMPSSKAPSQGQGSLTANPWLYV